MSIPRPDRIAEPAVELDPEVLGEEHVAEDDVAASPEEYEPEVVVDEPTREASPEDVAEQLAEVPGEDDEGPEADEGP
ncbi:hypothetical protein [Georgenia yuyongxinii]|uniref:Uncharacterized protein n=1 Tax=Georgenia yuyongxinii TaxID=2589797 RepID=A0A552WQW5_9MICO|nr:hypothetical protein [Georgenia yuyongxinii]TRW45114.1 hypothetical protein FJ693_10975 [Georgenia yuyongxinii]